MSSGNQTEDGDDAPDLTDIVEWLARIELRLDRIEALLELSEQVDDAREADLLDAEER